MSIAVERALRKGIRDRSFERVYYFRGDDDFLKDGTARELIAAALDPATRDFNLELLRGDETSPEALDTAVSTPPMCADPAGPVDDRVARDTALCQYSIRVLMLVSSAATAFFTSCDRL